MDFKKQVITVFEDIVNGPAIPGRKPRQGQRCACPSCEKKIARDSNYCPECGNEMPKRQYGEK